MPTATHDVGCQVRLTPQSQKSRIAAALLARLNTVSQLKYTAFDKVRLLSSDFKDFEIPAAQFIDVGTSVQHEQLRAKRFWAIDLELVLKSSTSGEVSQEDLWNLEYQVLRALFAKPNLGLKGVVHLKQVGETTDLHLLEPFYTSRISLEVEFYEDLVRSTNC